MGLKCKYSPGGSLFHHRGLHPVPYRRQLAYLLLHVGPFGEYSIVHVTYLLHLHPLQTSPPCIHNRYSVLRNIFGGEKTFWSRKWKTVIKLSLGVKDIDNGYDGKSHNCLLLNLETYSYDLFLLHISQKTLKILSTKCFNFRNSFIKPSQRHLLLPLW